jgi:hypothetical protein
LKKYKKKRFSLEKLLCEQSRGIKDKNAVNIRNIKGILLRMKEFSN